MSKFDRWSREGMPDDAANYTIQRGIDATMRSVVANRSIPQSASMIPDSQRAADEIPRAPGAGSVPITPPPGIEHIDRMVDAADKRDRIAAIRQAAENAWIESHFDKGPRIEVDYNPLSKEQLEK